MQYLYYILNKLNLTGNSIRLSFIKKISNSEITGKIKTKIGISNKDIKTQFTIYIIFIFTFLLILCLWYLFFPITLADVIPNIFNIEMPNIMITLIVFIVIAILNTGYIFLRRYLLFKTKEPKPKNINLYNRELPDNLTPAHARLLVYDGTIDSKTLACTILDLVDRGHLKLESGNKSEIFAKELFISKTNKSQNDLFEYEQFLINWFFYK